MFEGLNINCDNCDGGRMCLEFFTYPQHEAPFNAHCLKCGRTIHFKNAMLESEIIINGMPKGVS